MKTWIVASELILSLCVCAANDAKVSAAMVEKTRAAAAKGDAAAQFRYAEMLRDGRGVAKNMREAVVWTRKAADAGHAPAQCQMGLFYMNGLGVDHDEDKAVEWLNKAAAQNHAQAQYNLGIYYAKFSAREARRLALKWLKEVVKGDAAAQFNLAQLYNNLNLHHPTAHDYLLPNMWNIVSIIIAFASLLMTCYEFYHIAKKNAYDLKIKDIQAIKKPLCWLIKKNLYLDEMCEKCLAVGGWRQTSARITDFMNAPAYEDLLHDLIDILYGEVLNVLVFSSKTRAEIRRLIAHLEELDGLIVIVTDPETFRPQEIRKQICYIKEGWLRLAKLFVKDLMLNKKETSEFCEATIDYANSMEV